VFTARYGLDIYISFRLVVVVCKRLNVGISGAASASVPIFKCS
jgi:hypothetical protein